MWPYTPTAHPNNAVTDHVEFYPDRTHIVLLAPSANQLGGVSAIPMKVGIVSYWELLVRRDIVARMMDDSAKYLRGGGQGRDGVVADA